MWCGAVIKPSEGDRALLYETPPPSLYQDSVQKTSKQGKPTPEHPACCLLQRCYWGCAELEHSSCSFFCHNTINSIFLNELHTLFYFIFLTLLLFQWRRNLKKEHYRLYIKDGSSPHDITHVGFYFIIKSSLSLKERKRVVWTFMSILDYGNVIYMQGCT